MLGEKNINIDFYATGWDEGDNEAALIGDNMDIARWTAWPEIGPVPDYPGAMYYASFGSAHSNGVHMAFCDGSVQQIAYSIDTAIHRWLGNRKDGRALDAKKF